MNDAVLIESGQFIPAAQLESLFGWTIKAEGLCQGDVCIPVAAPERVRVEGDDDRVDIVAIAKLLDRPVAHDTATGIVAVGVPRHVRRQALNNLKAPDFTLNDLEGKPRSFSDYSNRKRLLFAFSSW